MPLIDLWESNPAAISSLSIEQIVTTAGDGNLKDNSECSKEFRQYLSQVSSEKLEKYTNQCLINSLKKGGLILQDIVNEIGRRLDFDVINGRYTGTRNEIGFDGIWTSPEGHAIVIEVKTTDVYRISLDTISNYKKELLNSAKISEISSILIVVGREDTGDLEAQVRGSKHAWDIRLISTDALNNLIELKESTDELDTAKKIRDVLIPMEYTKLDKLIDIMFTTAKDVESAVEQESSSSDEREEDKEKYRGFTDSSDLQEKRELIISAFCNKENTKLIKKTRALYWSSDHEFRAACTISKRYLKKGTVPYWYAYHPKWNKFLKEGLKSYFILGCMDLDIAFALPLNILQNNLEYMNTTERESPQEMYWHIKIVELDESNYALQLPKISKQLPLLQYQIKIDK